VKRAYDLAERRLYDPQVDSPSRLCGTSAAIELKCVTKTFGANGTAVDGLDLVVPRGALYGFIGPNGAGKTTTIRMIMSILFPDSGELRVLGHGSALHAKDRIGYLPEERGVYRKMRVGNFLRYMARLKGVHDKQLTTRVRDSLDRVGLGHAERKRCEELSKGMLQKVQFLAAIIHRPELIILDEPFSGLDPVNMRLLRELVLVEHERGATILFSTHVMPQAEEMCEHVVMVHRGRKVLDADVSVMRRTYDTRVLQLEPLDPRADLSPVRAIAGVTSLEASESGFEIRLGEGSDPRTVMREIVSAVAPLRLELSRPRLEDIFLRLVAHGDQADSADATELLRTQLRAEAGDESP
jgi:ABC-2 type transport system ATP-binding protein